MAFQISIQDKKSNIDLMYYDPIKLKEPYEVALQAFVSYNMIPNISESYNNNRLHLMYNNTVPINPVKPEAGVENVPVEIDIAIPDGTYEFKHLITLIEKVTENIVPGTGDRGVKLSYNENTLRTKIHCVKCSVDFRRPNSIGQVLGFSRERIILENHKENSDHVIDISPINTVRIQCSLIRSNIHDLDKNDNTIYEFPLNLLPGERIVERPQNMIYYTINTDAIYELSIRITDQTGKLIDFRDNRISIILAFRPVQYGFN
jgi:hypothetical protein